MNHYKHIMLSLDTPQDITEADVRYLIDFNMCSPCYGTDSTFYYDKETRCVVVSPYDSEDGLKTFFISAEVDCGDNLYDYTEQIELSITIMYPNAERKEFTAKGTDSYGAEYYNDRTDLAEDDPLYLFPIWNYYIRKFMKLSTHCMVSVPPEGATIFVSMTSKFNAIGGVHDFDGYEKTIVKASALVEQIQSIDAQQAITMENGYA